MTPKPSFRSVSPVALEMNETQAKHIEEKIRETIWNQEGAQEPAYWKPERLVALHGGQALNSENLHDLVAFLVEYDVFDFLPAIAGLLADAASDSDAFAKTLDSIYDKIGDDMASGPVAESIRSLGSSDPETALRIAERLLGYDDPGYAYLLIGGAAAKLPSRCEDLTNKLLGSDDARLWPVAINALVVTYVDSGRRAGEDVLKALGRASESNDIDVMMAAINAFILFYASDEKRSARAIEGLARRHHKCAWLLARRICTKPPFDEDTALHLLHTCSEFSDTNVKQAVYHALTSFVDGYLEDVLRIVVMYATRDGRGVEGEERLLERIGKAHGAKAVAAMLDMLGGQKPTADLHRHAPGMVMSLLAGAGSGDAMGPIFEAIRSKRDPYRIGIKALREVITDSGVGGASRGSMLAAARSFLERLAESMEINTDRIARDESDQAIICGHIIYAILHNAKPDYELVRKNMERFPEMRSLLGRQWIDSMRQDKRAHPILAMLGQKLPPKEEIDDLIKRINSARMSQERANLVLKLKHLAGACCFLCGLDRNLRTLKRHELDTAAYAEQMKNEKQFWNAISEINFTVRFLGKCGTEIKPKIGSKKLDARLDVGGRPVYVEIFNPETLLRPKLFSRGQAVPERIPGKTYDKFRNQLRGLDGEGHPVLLAIDMGESGTDYGFVEEYLLGPLIAMAHFDRNGGAAGLRYERMGDGSAHARDPGTDVISAVVCYKMRRRDDLAEQMEYKIFYNLHARYKIDAPTLRFLEECLGSKRAG